MLCVCVCESPYTIFRMPEPVFIKSSMYIMEPEPISTVYFINPSHQSLSLYEHVVRQQLSVNVNTATNTHTTIELLVAPFTMGSASYQRKVGY
jgi:hypothetical protein